MEIIFVHISVPDVSTAQKLGLLLVEARVAACVHMIPTIQTIYRWEEKVEWHEEILLIAKTTRERFGEVSALVRQNHPYKLPCIVASPISVGEPKYMKWIEENSDRLRTV